MSALADSMLAHAQKLREGQRAWARSENGWYHLTHEESLQVAKYLERNAAQARLECELRRV